MKRLLPLLPILFLCAPAQAQFWNFWRPACIRRAIDIFHDCRNQRIQEFKDNSNYATAEEKPGLRSDLRDQLGICRERRHADIVKCREEARARHAREKAVEEAVEEAPPPTKSGPSIDLPIPFNEFVH